ncbi:MAG: glycosyltransferase family 2 protein [Gammaproteobacteria bacterium]|nr:glycosyltransferase family 2 protein [Gammaproteobacteria bacterium]
MRLKFNTKTKNNALFAGLYLLVIGLLCLAFLAEPSDAELFSGTRLVLFLLVMPLIVKMLIQLYAAFQYRKQLGYIPTQLEKPKVSVLLPAYNEEVGIIKTIESVLDSDYPDFELVVINDGSTDNTGDLIRDFVTKHRQSEHKVHIEYLDLPNGGKAKALNHALTFAKGEIVITVDADCLMDKAAIGNFVKHFNHPQVGAVAGNVIVGNRQKPIELIQQLEYVCGFFFKRSDSYFNAVHIIGGAAAAYRRSVLQNLRGFDPEIITEDVEISMRILGHGFKTRYAHDAVIYTEGPSDWKGLCNQRLRWKYGRILTYKKHKELFFNQRHKNPYLSWLVLPLSLYAELILLFQVALVTLFFSYSFISGDYLPMLIMMAISTSMVTLQIRLDSKKEFHNNLLPLIPIAWLLLYAIDFVELQALTRSIKRIVKRQTLEWQKWSRVGLNQESAEQSV